MTEHVDRRSHGTEGKAMLVAPALTRRPGGRVAIALLVGLVPGLASAETQIRRGHEFVVNTYTYYVQRRVDAASAPNGDFVVVWETFPGTSYPNQFDILGQRYDAAGARKGGELPVIEDPQVEGNPSLAVAGDGSFVVAWEGYNYTSGAYEIGARRFSSGGVALGGKFTVNTTPYTYYNSAVASASDGSFVVAWGSYADYAEGDGGAIRARRFDATGAALGDDFLVNTYTTGFQGFASVAGTPDGRFVVAWEDNQRDVVVARRYDSSGAAQGDEFVVGTSPSFDVKVAAAPDGSFVVVWSDYADIAGRRYDGTGAPLGGQFVVNGAPAGYRRQPDVTVGPDGSFAVAWMSRIGFGAADVFARRFDSAGVPQSDDFKVNESYRAESSYRGQLAVTGEPDGSFVVVWRSDYGPGHDTDIIGQRLAPGTIGCTPAPRSDCKKKTAVRGTFRFKDSANDARDSLVWQWVKGEATAPGDFGDPFTNTAFALCVYDASGASQPVASAVSAANGPCVNGVLCWTALAGGQTIRYYDGAKLSDGLQLILLKPGSAGQARASLKASGPKLTLPSTPLTAPVTVQLQSSDGACFTSKYASAILANGGGQFRARPDIGP